jgi:hypothetical protein
MKMKLLPLVFFSGAVMAQERTVSSGGETTGSSGSVSYTIGLPDYSNYTGSSGSITEGVQQPYELFAVGIEEWNMSWEMNVFPNPTTSFLTVSMKESLKNASYTLTDAQGRLVQQGTLPDMENTIDLQSLAMSNYYLNIRVEEQNVRTYQIVKNN